MAEKDDEEVRALLTTSLGQRIAGGLMLVNAIIVFAEALLVPDRGALPIDPAGDLPTVSIPGAIFDVVIGGALLGGNSKVVGLALVRVVLGLVLFGGLRLAQGELLVAGLQAAVSAAFLLLLIGRAGRLRIALAGLLFGAYLLMEVIGLYVIRTGHNPIGGLVSTLRDDIEPEPAGEVVGVSSAYRLRAPSDRWYLRKPEAAKKDNPLAERWLTRPDLDAHVVVIAEDVPGAAVPVEALLPAVLDNARGAATRFELIDTTPLARFPEDGRLVQARATVNGLDMVFLYAIVGVYGHAYQAIAFAPERSFPGVEAELRAILDSFSPPDGPPELLERPERAPAGRVEGLAARYAVTAPNDRWYLRTAEAARKDSEVADRWIARPDRDANVFVIVEELEGPTEVDAFAAAVESMLASNMPGAEVSPRQRWSAGRTEGRRFHVAAQNMGLSVEYDYAVFVAGSRGFQVVGLTRKEFYPLVKGEILAALASFEPPPAAK